MYSRTRDPDYVQPQTGAAVNALSLVERDFAWLENPADPNPTSEAFLRETPSGGEPRTPGQGSPQRRSRASNWLVPREAPVRPSVVTLTDLRKEFAVRQALAVLPHPTPSDLSAPAENVLQRLLAEGTCTLLYWSA